MKKFSIILLYCLCITAFTGCFKDYEERYLFTDNRVEFEDAVINSNTGSKTFPILGPIDSEVGTLKYRVNMTGEQADVDREVEVRIVVEETTAREGIDYRFPHGKKVTIPANDSFGWLEIEILNDTGGGSPVLVVQLVETGDIGVLDRYHQLGVQIRFPFTAPDPSTVEELNGITYFKDITFGAHDNDNVGNYVDMETGRAYGKVGAGNNQDKIDFVILRSGAGSGLNLLTPSNSAVTAWPSDAGHIAEEWTVRNNGVITRITGAMAEDIQEFNDAESPEDLWALYDRLITNVSSTGGYSWSEQGPSTRTRHASGGDLLLFKSQGVDRHHFSIMRIEDHLDSSTGYISGEMKTGLVPEDRRQELTLTGRASGVASFIDFKRGVVLEESVAAREPENIDAIHLGGSGSKHNFISIDNGALTLSAWAQSLEDRVLAWPVQNKATVISMGSDQAAIDMYDALDQNDRAAMEAALADAETNGTISTNGRLQHVGEGDDIIILHSEDRGLIIAIKVVDVEIDGHITIEYKVSEP
ncbi:hypothetical protein [Sinomicrobium sp.]